MKIVLFSLLQVLSPEKDILKDVKRTGLDKLAEIGSTTLLKLRERTKQTVSIQELQQLLGTYEGYDLKSLYGNMKISIFTTDDEIFDYSKSISINEAKKVSLDKKEILLSISESKSDFIIINFVKDPKSIVLIDDIIQELFDKDYYIEVLMTFDELKETKEEKRKFPQSYNKFKGKEVLNIRENCPGILCSYHKDRTRRDFNNEYTEKSCFEKNGNGTILIDQLLTELSYKLGFTPKYGA